MVRVLISANNAFVWDAEEWLKLRQDHRILGSLRGSIAQAPRQDAEMGLPMSLMAEEVSLLIEKKIGTVFQYKDKFKLPSEDLVARHNQYLESVKKEQIEWYETKRRNEIEGMIDRIVEGKKRKMFRTNSSVEVDREAILEAELAKVNPLAQSLGVNIQIPTAHAWFEEGDVVPAQWDFPKTPTEKLRYKVFKDLWEKGYYLSPGGKFGGDFLAYPGEPVLFHAFFIVRCVSHDYEFPLTRLTVNARLGTVTKKTLVLASSKEENAPVVYNSVEWVGTS